MYITYNKILYNLSSRKSKDDSTNNLISDHKHFGIALLKQLLDVRHDDSLYYMLV